MVETVINLKPESEWRPGMTVDKLTAEMDKSLQFPGVSNAWTMPIKARIDMLSTGIRTPIGVKVFGKDLAEIDKIARAIEAAIRTVRGTASAYAERAISGYYLNVDPDRAQLARYGLMVGDVQNVIAMALGAEPVTATVEGRERYTVSIRYPRDYRSDPEAIADQVLIPMPDGGTVPLRQAAKVESSPRTRQASAPKTRNSPPTSISTFVTAISAATSPTRRRPSLPKWLSLRAITRFGAGSSNTSSAPRRGSRWSYL